MVEKFERVGGEEKGQSFTCTCGCFQRDGSKRRGMPGGNGNGIDAEEECSTQDGAEVTRVELCEMLVLGEVWIWVRTSRDAYNPI